jgi:hypothetical protein
MPEGRLPGGGRRSRSWLLISQRCREPRAASRSAIAGTREADRAPL